jgi:hypothetical protein
MVAVSQVHPSPILLPPPPPPLPSSLSHSVPPWSVRETIADKAVTDG